MTSSTSSPALPRSNCWTSSLLVIAVLMTCGLCMAMNDADPDLWGHAQFGRELLQTGVLPKTTTWSFAEKNFVWVNHEILAEVAIAWTEDHLGVWGLTVGKYLASLLLVGLLYWQGRRQGVSHAVLAPMSIVMALAMEFHWHLRPQIFGYLFFALLLVVLNTAFKDWSKIVSGEKQSSVPLWQLLWLLPLMCLWANTHGSFPAGLCVAAAVIGLRGAELLLARIRGKISSTAPTSSVVARQLGFLTAIGGLTVGATLANPYGTKMYVWLWEALKIPCSEIDDWTVLPFWTASRESLCAWMILGSTLLTVIKNPKRDWVLIIVFSLVAWQSILHIRHLPMLAMLWVSWFALPVDQLRATFMEAMKPREANTTSHPKAWIGYALLLWIAVIGAATWPKLAHLNVDKGNFPVDAFHFLARHQLAGRTVVTFNWAQYAIGFFNHTGLKSQVAFDGRYRTSYSQKILDRYFDFTFGTDYDGPRYRSPESGPVDPTLALTQDDPELIVLSRLQRPSVRTMSQQTDRWSLLFQDGLSQIWGRRDLFDNPASARHLLPQDRLITDKFPHGLVQYPAYPQSQAPSLPTPALATIER